MLVLERVGGHLTMPMKLSNEDKFIYESLVGAHFSFTVDVDRDQIYCLYKELAYLIIATKTSGTTVRLPVPVHCEG